MSDKKLTPEEIKDKIYYALVDYKLEETSQAECLIDLYEIYEQYASQKVKDEVIKYDVALLERTRKINDERKEHRKQLKEKEEEIQRCHKIIR